ncbi:MAG: metal ABC transporter ATP-binding protein [Actinomycetota bacterium]|nr:MAG: metal ABC transporter ATP-binding protein [Actinomycetota bacterium]
MNSDTYNSGPVLAISKMSIVLGGNEILHDVNFELHSGEFSGLIGPNGSGKTTLLRTILGFHRPAEGSIHFEGKSGFANRRSIGYVPQKILLDPDVPVRARDLVELGLDGHRLGIRLPSKERRRQVDDMLHAVNAEAFADQRIGQLSGGQQQRILIAHALIRRPRLLLLDEPLANLDIRSVAEVVNLLNQLAHQQRIAILLSAHDINPLMGAMDRLVYVANGHAASGPVNEVIDDKVLSTLYGYHVDVIRVHGRILITTGPGDEYFEPGRDCVTPETSSLP